MKVLENIGVLATCRPDGPQGEIHAIRDAALVWEGETILWTGPGRELPVAHATAQREDAGGRLVIPGLVDCHTHLAFGGWRADEFERRIRGESYLDIARGGGGIMSTVRDTRAAGEPDLAARGARALGEMVKLGVTTVEAKSGYGLDREHELTLLRVYRTLAERGPVRLVPTFLGAHVVPAEFADRRGDYVRLVIDMLPEIANARLARACDVFVEKSAFTLDEARAILTAAKGLGLGLKLHADQLSDGGGAALAAELGALSADHLEHISADGIRALAMSAVIAVSLPLATLYLNERPMPARALIDAGVPVAVATDFNPGSAPSWHLPFALTLACTLQRMTPAEALKGATIHAARAVGLQRRVGSLEPGKMADFAIVDAPDVTHWLYQLRPNACVRTVIGGRTVWNAQLPAIRGTA
jgi:imidazolonepropionase